MKVKMFVMREIQDQGFPGSVLRLDGGVVYDLPDVVANGLINAGSATGEFVATEKTAGDDLGHAVEEALYAVDTAQADFDAAKGRGKAPAAAKLAEAKAKLEAARAALAADGSK